MGCTRGGGCIFASELKTNISILSKERFLKQGGWIFYAETRRNEKELEKNKNSINNKYKRREWIEMNKTLAILQINN